ncbi:hypothetical protein [Pedobacter aquatilis]|uniref:hypothetical protein n=1 Tax=Pedobacter aquatilis TaxID=351343 RepID=UPI002931989B|nr:hypothetical protein [Pedobacter aquatilis]
MTKKILKNFLVYFLHYHFFYYICRVINEVLFFTTKKDKSSLEKRYAEMENKDKAWLITGLYLVRKKGDAWMRSPFCFYQSGIALNQYITKKNQEIKQVTKCLLLCNSGTNSEFLSVLQHRD